jgi:hypothetical protein
MGYQDMTMKAATISAILQWLVFAAPCSAQILGLAGTWRGEGAIIVENVVKEKLKCRMSSQIMEFDAWNLLVRCATFRGPVEIELSLRKTSDASIAGLVRLKAESGERKKLQGKIFNDFLRLETDDNEIMELIMNDEGLHFKAWEDAGDDQLIQVLFPM